MTADQTAHVDEDATHEQFVGDIRVPGNKTKAATAVSVASPTRLEIRFPVMRADHHSAPTKYHGNLIAKENIGESYPF